MSLRQPPVPSQHVAPEPAEGAPLPALWVLCERVRAPEAGRAEVNALLRGLSRTLGEEEPPRERADLLLQLIEDERVGSFRGSDGQRVCAAAAKALLALGHPYALELSPEALDVMRADEREARSFVIYEGKGAPAEEEEEEEEPGPVVFAPRQQVGFWLVLGLVAVELLVALSVGGIAGSVVGLLFIVLTGIGPASVLGTETGVRNRVLHYTCLTLMGLASVPLLWVGGVFWLMNGYMKSETSFWYLVPLSLGVARLAAVYCMHARNPRRAR